MKVFIGGAWVYANGPLHIGHIAGLLPGDVIARYYRQKGEEVCYVSGSDCHGTPITIRAKKEGLNPETISDKYHEEFRKGFDYLGFSYDHYGKTSSHEHKEFVTSFHRELYESPLIEEREVPQAYCPSCQKFLSDRLVEGTCPQCGGVAKGEQCDHCHSVLSSLELVDPWCHDCHTRPEFVQEKHLYLKISDLEKNIDASIKEDGQWRKNAVDFTRRYIEEGLRDRAITRSLDWGIDVPKEGYDTKKIYIWAENVLGYLSACKEAVSNPADNWEDYFTEESRNYYVHGKDNIPFHTIILPSLLSAHGNYDANPDYIISSEHLTLEGSKISTSNNWAIWINDLIDQYNPDTIRYYLSVIYPERRDSDFSARELKYANNSELLGGYGNFVNRTLSFVKKTYDDRVPQGKLNPAVRNKIKETFDQVGKHLEVGEIKKGIKAAFELVRFGNKYFDENKPWITVKEDPEVAANTLLNCIFLIINLSLILRPFLPFSAKKVENWLGYEPSWCVTEPVAGALIGDIRRLFDRLED